GLCLRNLQLVGQWIDLKQELAAPDGRVLTNMNRDDPPPDLGRDMHHIRIDGGITRGTMLTDPGRGAARDHDGHGDYCEGDEAAARGKTACGPRLRLLRLGARHLNSIVHTNSPTMTPVAVQTASWKGSASLKTGLVRATRVAAAPMIPISAQNIHAGKKAP